jgi:hypothetical protein
MTMAEKMARAMFPWAWDGKGSHVEQQRDRQETLSKALLALEAMRDPTSPMCMPGINAIEQWDEDYDPKTVMDGRSIACWRAMIDAAILEAKQ